MTRNTEFNVPCCDRIGLAPIARMAMQGKNMRQFRQELMSLDSDPGVTMDLAVVEQILGNREVGLQIQNEALKLVQCFRPSGNSSSPSLRVVAFAAPTDIGGNTPIEFLTENSEIELNIFYVLPNEPFEHLVPDHDLAIVIVSDDGQAPGILNQIKISTDSWARPILNRPMNIGNTDRDQLYVLAQTIPNLHVNPTVKVARDMLRLIADDVSECPVSFPFIVRPLGSHAGNGLARLSTSTDIHAYLNTSTASDFFISPFTDYSSEDGLFRKYRIVLIGGNPFACHMAISDQWAIWYLNADMAASLEKRAEEAAFMEDFDSNFGRRHHAALSSIATRLDLDYFVIDCAETKDGKLLLFEAGVAMIVHDLDHVETFPYKPKQMQKIFDAFKSMLVRRAALDTRR